MRISALHYSTSLSRFPWSQSKSQIDCTLTSAGTHICSNKCADASRHITSKLQPILLMPQSIFSRRHLTSGPQPSALVKPLEFHYTSLPIRSHLHPHMVLGLLWGIPVAMTLELMPSQTLLNHLLWSKRKRLTGRRNQIEWCMCEVEAGEEKWGGWLRLYQYYMRWASRGCIPISGSSCHVSVMQPVPNLWPWKTCFSVQSWSCPVKQT